MDANHSTDSQTARQATYSPSGPLTPLEKEQLKQVRKEQIDILKHCFPDMTVATKDYPPVTPLAKETE